MKFQHFLLVALAAFFVYALRARRQSVAGKLFVLTLLSVLFSLASWPEASNRVAHRLGNGRGVDLLLYISNLLFLFVIFLHHLKFRELEARIAILARAAALGEARAEEGRVPGGGRSGGSP